MNIVPFKAEHLMDLQLQESQQFCGPAVSPQYAMYLEGEFSFTALDGDKVLCVGGVTAIWDNRAIAWMLVDGSAGKHFVEIHKAAKRMLDMVPYARVEADTPCEFEAGHKWLKMLGFQLEAERMRAHRIDGGDSALYARVK